MGSQMKCSMGAAPSALMPTFKPIMTNNKVAANIMDHVPMLNILPFGVCKSLANPTVAAATAAAMGTLTPMPCIPATPAPWIPGAPTVLVANFPALDNTSKLMCMWAGVIEFTDASQANHQIP
jgi:hypothetical protein